MELLPAGVPLSFEATFSDSGLPVAMSVYDDSGSTPVKVSGPAAMLNFVGTTYRGKFTGQANIPYLVVKEVYTDNSYTTLDENYIGGSESFIATYLQTPPGSGEIIGFISNQALTGEIDC